MAQRSSRGRQDHHHHHSHHHRTAADLISPSSSFRHSSASSFPPLRHEAPRSSCSSTPAANQKEPRRRKPQKQQRYASPATRRSTAIVAASSGVTAASDGLFSYLSSHHPDFDKYEVQLHEKRRSAIDFISGIFTCWSKTHKDGATPGGCGGGGGVGNDASKLNAADLLQQAKAQQEALLETQDTSDMWEWMMEQQQAIANQEHELMERSLYDTNDIVSRNILGDNDDDDDEDEDDDMMLGSPVKLWRRGIGNTNGGAAGAVGETGDKLVRLFEAALLRCRWEINTFCRVYMQQIVRAGYSLVNTLMEMEPKTVFVRRVHASYALEGRINAALFRCFENDSFDDSGLTHILDVGARSTARLAEYSRLKGMDPAEALRMQSPAYEPAFHAFAAAKSEEVLSLLPAAALAFRSATQRDRFMEAFLRAAKWAWLLHRLATSASPPFTILRVARGHPVDPLYVEAVSVPPIGSCSRCHVTSLPAVEFMITPGFVAPQRKVFRCRVYQHFMCKRSSTATG